MDRLDFLKWVEDHRPQGRVRSFKRQHTLLLQGDIGQTLNVILTGEVAAMALTESGEEIWLATYGPGDLIGQLSTLSNRPAIAQLVATKKTSVLEFSRSYIEASLADDAALSPLLFAILTDDFEALAQSYIKALTLSIKGRVCSELIKRATPLPGEEGQYVIRPAPVISRLADRLNTRRETVSRAVGELVEEGLLLRRPGAMQVTSLPRLKRLVTLR
ncbi:MAG: Crp/Fnr family transcriptional regulator [Pseudomonadota bacterium]